MLQINELSYTDTAKHCYKVHYKVHWQGRRAINKISESAKSSELELIDELHGIQRK